MFTHVRRQRQWLLAARSRVFWMPWSPLVVWGKLAWLVLPCVSVPARLAAAGWLASSAVHRDSSIDLICTGCLSQNTWDCGGTDAQFYEIWVDFIWDLDKYLLAKVRLRGG